MLMRVMGSFLTAGQLDRTIRYGLVRVHVGLGPAPRLPNAQGEMVVEFSGDDLVRCRDDQASFLFGQLSQIVIRFRTHKSFCPEKGRPVGAPTIRRRQIRLALSFAGISLRSPLMCECAT